MLKRSLPRYLVAAATGAAVLAPPAVADAPPGFQPRPQAIAAGPISIIPGFASATQFDDNIFQTPTAEQQSWVQTLSPSVLFLAQDGNSSYSVFTEYAKTWYSSSHDDDEDRYRVLGEANVELNARNHVDAFAEYHDTFEPRGSGFSQGTGGTGQTGPDDYHTNSYGLAYTYGLRDGNRIEVRGSHTNLEYDSRPAVTRFRDREDESFGATFFWKVSPDTELFIQGDNTDIEYDRTPTGGTTLDSEEKTVMVGASWNITGLTTGTAKIGRTSKDFESTARSDESSTAWELGLEWLPLSYSKFGVTSSKGFEETNGTGNTYLTSQWEVYNIHNWSERVRSRLSYSDATDEYEGGGTTREDDRERYLIGLDYQFRRWLVFGLEASRTEKDSNVNAFDFERNIYALTITASM